MTICSVCICIPSVSLHCPIFQCIDSHVHNCFVFLVLSKAMKSLNDEKERQAALDMIKEAKEKTEYEVSQSTDNMNRCAQLRETLQNSLTGFYHSK